LNSGWSSGDEISTGPHFNFSLTLTNVYGLAEDYKKVLSNFKHELVLMLTKMCAILQKLGCRIILKVV